MRSLPAPSSRLRAPVRASRAGQASLAGLALALALATSSPACGSAEPGTDGVLAELERLAFVPAGSMVLSTGGGELAVDVREPLLVDMFEVTRGDWLAYLRGAGGDVDAEHASHVETWAEGTEDWPATFMTAGEAAEFARWRGMRLLSSGEWLYCAVGPQRRLYPWGPIDQRGKANTLDLDLGRLAPVGTFEAGRTYQYVYDLLGNSAEWTRDAASATRRAGDTRVSALGGSFRTYSRPIFDPRPAQGQDEILARTLAPASRADDIGTRCCVEARAYLALHGREIAVGEVARRRLNAVGKRWGTQAVPLLRDLTLGTEPTPGLEALLEGARR